MIRNLFIDFVIVMAFCAVVWGSVPVVVAQIVEKKDLPPGTITTGKNSNRCCKSRGDKDGTACGAGNQHGVHAWCISTDVDCSYVFNWLSYFPVRYPCSCGNWVKAEPGMPGWYTALGCGCS